MQSIKYALLTGSLLLAGIAMRPCAAHAGDSVVAGHEKGVVAGLGRADLKKYLAGLKRAWPDGTPVVIVLPPKGSAEMAHLCEIVGMPEGAYRRFLSARVFRGKLARPAKAGSAAETAAAIATKPGSIGVVATSLVKPPIVQIGAN